MSLPQPLTGQADARPVSKRYLAASSDVVFDAVMLLGALCVVKTVQRPYEVACYTPDAFKTYLCVFLFAAAKKLSAFFAASITGRPGLYNFTHSS